MQDQFLKSMLTDLPPEKAEMLTAVNDALRADVHGVAIFGALKEGQNFFDKTAGKDGAVLRLMGCQGINDRAFIAVIIMTALEGMIKENQENSPFKEGHELQKMLEKTSYEFFTNEESCAKIVAKYMQAIAEEVFPFWKEFVKK